MKASSLAVSMSGHLTSCRVFLRCSSGKVVDTPFNLFPVKSSEERRIDQSIPTHSYRDPSRPLDRARLRGKPRVFGCGNAQTGALGIVSTSRPTPDKPETRKKVTAPYRLKGVDRARIVACGSAFTIFSVTSGQKSGLYGSGLNSFGQLGDQFSLAGERLEVLLSIAPITLNHPDVSERTKFPLVACGRTHCVVVTNQNKVLAFGSNAHGQCGRPIIPDEDYSTNCRVQRLEGLPEEKVTSVVCGFDHSMVLTECGKLYSCGWNADGQLGLGHYDRTWEPSLVQGDIKGEKIVQISSFADTVLAVNDKGDMFGWGNTEYGQLSVVTPSVQLCTPRHLKYPQLSSVRVRQVACGGSTCALLTSDGRVMTWGYGQLGTGPNVDLSHAPTTIPQRLFGAELGTEEQEVPVRKIACGLSHFAAINRHDELFTWGGNAGGCLGLNSRMGAQSFPLNIHLRKDTVEDVACGVDHTIFLSRTII